MDGYVEQALREFKNCKPHRSHNSPSYCKPPKYGTKVQYAEIDDSPPLNAEQIKYIQWVVVEFLFYAQAIDITMMHCLNEISTGAFAIDIKFSEPKLHCSQLYYCS